MFDLVSTKLYGFQTVVHRPKGFREGYGRDPRQRPNIFNTQHCFGITACVMKSVHLYLQ